MIANKQQFDSQWLHTHGGARRRTKLDLFGAALKAQAPIMRYQMQLQERHGVAMLFGGRVCACDYANRALPTRHNKGCVYA